MSTEAIVLSDFHSLLPKFSNDQASAIRWLASAHAESQITSGQLKDEDKAGLISRMEKRITRFGCDPGKIETRYSALDDFKHQDWSKMRLFRLNESPAGAGTLARSRFFEETVNEVFRHFYAETERGPERLIHVTCTGYVSPSGAQRLVAEKNWGTKTEVTHAYHMGCYASLPSVRMAQGYLATEAPSSRVDLVHTELCSIHMDPSQEAPEQLVVQSLFADGFMKYTARPLSAWLSADSNAGSGRLASALEVLALREEIIPGSEDAMTWIVSDVGMKMTLSRDVPEMISGVLAEFLSHLGVTDGLDPIYAIHPGGPKIIDLIERELSLSDHQIHASRKILRERGNMSSATLPHVWKELLEDPSIPDGKTIVSLAFGPGLTVSGGLFRKRTRA